MVKSDYNRMPKAVHCKCTGCKFEGLNQPGFKCFKCPKGFLRAK